jgi:hypothetical protein
MIVRYFTLAVMIVSASVAYTMQPTDNTKATWTKPKHQKVKNNNDGQRAHPVRPQRPQQPQRPVVDPAELNRIRRRLDF